MQQGGIEHSCKRYVSCEYPISPDLFLEHASYFALHCHPYEWGLGRDIMQPMNPDPPVVRALGDSPSSEVEATDVLQQILEYLTRK